VNIPTVNSFIMQQSMPYAQLIIYPDSKRWLGKSAQWGKWSFCLTTARMAEDQELSWADGDGGTTQRPSRREWRWRR
jgi:hypothetical protein